MKHKHDVHVVYIITTLELGGAQKVCLSLFNGIQRHGISSSLIASSQGLLTKQIKNHDNAILLTSLQRDVGLRSIMNEARCFFTLVTTLRALKKQHPHIIVHTHSTKAGILGRWAAFFAGIKSRVHTVHGFAFHEHQSYITWLCIYITELLTSFVTTQYICVSSHDVKTGIHLFPHFARKHTIIRAAIDWKQFYTPARKTTPFPENSPFIYGTISCFKPQKNLIDLFKAFAQVAQQNPNVVLEVIGDGILRPELESWITQNNMQHNIRLLGWQHVVAPYMGRWHAFVLSSLWEGLPCAIVEARMLKLPVLCYDTGGIHDVILNSENGMLFPKGAWQTLAQGMLTLSRDQKLYTKFQMHHDNLDDFNDEHMIIQHEALYRQLDKFAAEQKGE